MLDTSKLTARELEKLEDRFNNLTCVNEISEEAKPMVLNFLHRGFWNFCFKGGTVFCIGGPSYDRTRISIRNSDGQAIATC